VRPSGSCQTLSGTAATFVLPPIARPHDGHRGGEAVEPRIGMGRGGDFGAGVKHEAEEEWGKEKWR
jgi:hypothetical protein